MNQMEKEQQAIRMQRYLRPLTAVPKAQTEHPISSKSLPRAMSAAHGRSTKMGLRKPHLKAPVPKNPDEVSSQSRLLDMTYYGDNLKLDLTSVCSSPDTERSPDGCCHDSGRPVSSDSCVAEEIQEAKESEQIDGDITPQRSQGSEANLTRIKDSISSSQEFLLSDEEDLSPRVPSIVHGADNTGKLIYEEHCRINGITPISLLCRHMGERHVQIKHRYLGSTGVKPLALAFQHNTVTESLDLSDNSIDEDGAVCLAQMLQENQSLTLLNLSHNSIGSSGMKAISDMLESNTTLKGLSLSGNRLSDKDAQHLINALKNNNSLTSLDLSHNELAILGGRVIGRALSINEGLVDVNLSWNTLRKQGAAAIANALKMNLTLEFLDLSWNGFGLDGAAALQRSLSVNRSLKVLDLSNNRLGAEAARKLALGLKRNCSLESLMLSTNPLGDEGMESILNSLDLHPTMSFLAFEGLDVSQANETLIEGLELKTGMIVLRGGLSCINRNTILGSLHRLFTKFKTYKSCILETFCLQHDTTRTGRLPTEDMKSCLRSAGLCLSTRYIDLLVEDMDFDHTKYIDYRTVLSQDISEKSKRHRLLQKMAAAKAEESNEDCDSESNSESEFEFSH